MNRHSSNFETPAPRVSRDTAAQLERLLSSLILNSPAGSTEVDRTQGMSVSLVSIKSETAVSYQSSHCDDHRVGCSGDGYRPVDPYGAYLVLLKAIEAFKELQLGNQSADSVTRLRQSLLGLAFRVRDHEKESQELRDQLARSEESLRLCKARAANAEHHLAILTLAVSRLGIA